MDNLLFYVFITICFGSPIILSIFNVVNFFKKKKIYPRIFHLITFFLGGVLYIIFLRFSNVVNVPWNQATYSFYMHQPINSENLLSIVIPCAIGFISCLLLAFVPSKKISPIIALLILSGVLIGNIENILVAIQFSKCYLNNDKFFSVYPIIFHLNILMISIFYIKKQIKEQIESIEERKLNSHYTWQLKLYNFLSKISGWNILSFACVVPVAIIIEIVLILCGQGIDGAVKAFTMTADWTFSMQTPPPPLEYSGHYLCTVAAQGHTKIVKPLRFGNRHNQKIVVNRQLLVSNAFEELIQERFPKFHKAIRGFYDKHGYPLSKIITTKFRADLIYILMKPLEYFFVIVLYLFCTNPEERIKRQYL